MAYMCHAKPSFLKSGNVAKESLRHFILYPALPIAQEAAAEEDTMLFPRGQLEPQILKQRNASSSLSLAKIYHEEK